MRDYIPNPDLKIDGRNIPYKIVTARDYLLLINIIDETQESFEEFVESNYDIYQKLTQIIGLKNSIYLLRRASHSCQSITDNLYYLECRLFAELRNNYNFEVNENLLEELNL